MILELVGQNHLLKIDSNKKRDKLSTYICTNGLIEARNSEVII